MYNEICKRRYTTDKEKTTSTPNRYLLRQFEKTEKFEVKFDKDISCFTKYEIMDMYKTMSVSSLESLIVLNSHFSMYTNWCLQQNLVPDCQNHFTEFDMDDFTSCINSIAVKKSIITKETLYKWVDESMNPSDAFVLIALFEGIKGKNYCEISNLKMSDFNGNKVRLCTGREIDVSNKLLEVAQESNLTLTYYSITGYKSKTVQLLDEDYIIKRYPNVSQSSGIDQPGRRIYRKVIRALNFFEVEDLMPNDIMESGKLDYIITRCKELHITPKQYMDSDELTNQFKEKYDFDLYRVRSIYYSKYKQYLE